MPYSDKQYLQPLTKDQQLDIMNVDFFSNKKLDVIESKKAFILPPIFGNEDTAWFIGGVLDEKEDYIDESGQYAYGERNRVYGKYDFDPNNVPYIDEEVIYFNFYLSQWGHYLLDVIGRLWYIIKHPEYKIVYTTDLHGKNNIKNNFLQLLELAGIDRNRLIFVNEVTKFKKVIIPETSILVAKYYTKEYKQIIDTFVKNALDGQKLSGNKKIYCSRKHFNDKRVIELGEEKIEKVYRDNDYEIVYLEELDLIQQIRLLNDCKEIACVSGTLVHNAMFIRNKECNFTVLNKTYKINPNIYLTNQLCDVTFTFVDIYLSPLPISIGKGPFIMCITTEFENYCKENNISIKNKNSAIVITELIKYYISYIKKYRKKIFKGKLISESGFEKYDVTYKEIRKHFKKELKVVNQL